MLTNQKLQYPRHRTIVQANRVKFQSEDSGPLPAETDGSAPTDGVTTARGIRGSDSFAVLVEPVTPLESGGNVCVREGVTAHPKHAPFAVALRHHRRSTVDGTTRVRPRSNRWRSPGIRTRRCDARYRVRHRRIPRPSRTPNTPDPRFEGRRVAHEPGTLHARSGSCLRGTRDRPDVVRETTGLPSSRNGEAVSNDPTEESSPFRAGRMSKPPTRGFKHERARH